MSRWPSAEDRFHANYVINRETACWEWTARLDRDGYGHLRVDGPRHLAHRFAYTMLVGPIPEGLTIDHLCRVRHCVNPEHMEPVTRAVNTLRGVSFSAQLAKQVACKRGHVFDEANTYRWHGYRICRTCRSEYVRARRTSTSTSTR